MPALVQTSGHKKEDFIAGNPWTEKNLMSEDETPFIVTYDCGHKHPPFDGWKKRSKLKTEFPKEWDSGHCLTCGLYRTIKKIKINKSKKK